MGAAPALASIVRRCCQEHDWDQPLTAVHADVAGRDLAGLVARADAHGVSNLVYLSLRGLSDVDPAALEALEQRYFRSAAGHLQALADLETLSGVLDRLGSPWAVFKGPVLAERVYARPELRRYGDLDALVDPLGFAEAVEALEAEGCRLVDRNWDFLARHPLGQLRMVLPRGTVLDLHWHLLNRPAVRQSLSVDVSGVLSRSRRVQVGSAEVSAFHAVDALVHLCVHAALDGGQRLLWLKDVERSIGVERPCWGGVVARSREWQAAPLVGTILRRAQRSVGADVPSGVLRTLLGSTASRVFGAALDRAWPPERSTGDANPAALWARFRRQGPVGTAAFAVRRARSGVAVQMAHARFRRAAAADAAGRTLALDAGGEAARAAFFRYVRTQGTAR